MRGRWHIGGLRGVLASAVVATVALAAAALPAGGNVALAPPAPCSPAVVITDSATDGHHQPTDVLSAWFSEETGGNLQAVIVVDLGNWHAEHDDADEVVAGYAFLFTKGGLTRFVRLRVDGDFVLAYDYGTYTFPNTFTSEGATTGTLDPVPVNPPTATGDGTAVIDVPTTLANDGDLLEEAYVLTYDGIIGGVPTWVDHAPGGEVPVDPSTDPRGPDYLVGSCSSVSVASPASVKGAKTVTVSGTIAPAAEGVDVAITRQTLTGATAVTNTTTNASGGYSAQFKVRETTNVSAEANGISSTTRKITMRSTVKIQAIRLRNGKIRIKGMTNPWLPGRVQLFKTTAFTPTASKQIQGGAFSFTPRRLGAGRWEVLYTPANGRAVRSFSAAVRVQ